MNQSDDTRHNGSSDGWESVTVKKRQPRVILQNCDNSHHAKSHFNTKSTRNSTHGPILPNRSQVGNVRLHDNMSTRVNYAKDAVYSKNRVVQSTFIPLLRENLKVACLVPSKSVCETETPSTLKISNIRTEIKPFIAAPAVIASENITASNLPRRSTEGAYDLMMFLKTPKSNSKTQLKNVDNRKLDTNRPRFDINEEFKARRFVATKRKKKFTKMKKRILMVCSDHISRYLFSDAVR